MYSMSDSHDAGNSATAVMMRIAKFGQGWWAQVSRSSRAESRSPYV